MSENDDGDKLLKTASAELSSLSRVDHKLAMTEANNLERVLSVLLSRLLSRIGSNHVNQKSVVSAGNNQLQDTYQKIHEKLVSMLSHIMKRVRSDPNCKLPCEAILKLLLVVPTMTTPSSADDDDNLQQQQLRYESAINPFTLNLALAFLTLGVPRGDLADVQVLLPGLLVVLEAHSSVSPSPSRKLQATQVAHLVLRVLERIVLEESVPSSSKKRPPSMMSNSSSSTTSTLSGVKAPKSTVPLSHVMMNDVHPLLASNTAVAQSLYELLLDVLLYQTSPSPTMPPPGLSQWGHERLRSGTSSNASKDWAAEMAATSRLRDFKLALLTLIAPTRRWAIFLGPGNKDDLGMSRTIALLVATTGDSHGDVGERANSYLKAHLDTLRSKPTTVDEEDESSSGLGNPISIMVALLSLTLGDANAETALAKLKESTAVSPVSESLALYPQSSLLPMKRRMASEKTSAGISAFCAKLMDETPHLLLDLPNALAVGTLAVTSASTILSGYTSGLTTQQAGAFVAAAQLLNALSVRLAASPTILSNPTVLETIMLKALATACSVVSQASSPRSSSSRSTSTNPGEGSAVVRDSSYGVICALSRCLEFCETGRIFGVSTTSIETATLLFQCAANEEETLRPRAVAALDALLGAYSRVYKEEEEVNTQATPSSVVVPVNPWMTTPVSPEQTPAQKNTVQREALSKALLPLLWSAAQASKTKASRVASATWSKELLKLLDIPNSCHLLCWLAGDSDVTAAAIAREGLGLNKKVGEPYEPSTDMSLPDFCDIARVLFSATDQSSTSWRPRYYDFTHLGKAATLRFGLDCLLNDLYGGEESAVKIYVDAVCHTFQQFGRASGGKASVYGREAVDLLDECAISFSGCITASKFSRSLLVTQQTSYGVEDLKFLAVHGVSSKARRYLAESIGTLYEDHEIWSPTGESSMPSIDEWVTSCGLQESMAACAKKLKDMHSSASYVLGEVHGAAFLGARSIRAFRLFAAESTACELSKDNQLCWQHASEILAALGKGTMHKDEVIGNAFSKSIEIALSYGAVDAPILDIKLYTGVTDVLMELNKALQNYLNGDNTDPLRASSAIKGAGIALAASTAAAGYVSETIKIGPARLAIVDSLFGAIGSTAFRKDPEIALLAGEAFAEYADAYSPENAVWSVSSKQWPETFDEDLLNDLPPHEQCLYGLLGRELLASSPHKRTAVAPALMAIVAHAAKVVNSNRKYASRALVVELIKHLPEVQGAFIRLLADPKSKQLSRESCCLGLAACQGLAEAVHLDDKGEGEFALKDSLNDSLLKAFGQTTNHGGSAMMESRAQNTERLRQERRSHEGSTTNDMTEPFGIETSEVGGAAGLGEAALGAYREMAAAAVALGRSDILYALLLLSISHSVWFTVDARDRYSAAALLGESSLVGDRTNAVEIRNALRPQIGKLIPRLLRAKHDPNKQTREQMETLWLGLTGGGAEARQAITEHLLPTIDVLIDDGKNKLWRARVGACGALAEVIVGRSWEDLGGGDAVLEDDEIAIKTSTAKTKAGVRLLRLWRVAMRAIDDVRLAVRESGESLARSVRALTIRLCDPTATLGLIGNILTTEKDRKESEEEARAASSTALRWLVDVGLDQKCAEAAGVCVSCLIGIVEVVRPVTLEPVLPELIGSLLMAMSGLEPAALNYLQVRAAGRDSTETYDRLEQARLQFAQTGPIAKALNKCLDMINLVDITVQQAIVPQLDSALRGGAGFATRAATADSVSSMCNSCPFAFKFPGSSSTNPTVRLLRALYFASERERGAAAKDKMSHALGNLAALSPGQSVRALALRACDRYNTATGNNDDPITRRAAAAAVRSIVVRAQNQVADGGPNDIWSRKVLPVAFLGRKDKDAKISSLWKEVWDEGGSALGLNGREGFGVLVEEQLLPGLVKACVGALEDVSWARRVTGATSLSDLCAINVLSPVPRAVNASAVKQSAHDLERASRRAKAACAALTSCVSILVKPRIWTGKTEVVKASVKIAAQWATAGNSAVALGWDQPENTCSWIPVSTELKIPKVDLFVGDGYFERTAPQEDDDENTMEEGSAVNPESAESEGDGRIDFSEGEELFSDKNDSSADDQPTSDQQSRSVSFLGLGRVLVDLALPQSPKKMESVSQEEVLPFKAAALAGLTDLLKVLKSGDSSQSTKLKQTIYEAIGKRLLMMVDTEHVLINETDFKKDQPPLLVARSTAAIGASLWNGIGDAEDPLQSPMNLAKVFQNVGGPKQGAWTVREAALLGASELALVCNVEAFRKHSLLGLFLESGGSSLKDRKFWRVRVAGLTLVKSLVSRAGANSAHRLDMHGSSQPSAASTEQQMILEALLPFKEDILKLARASLKDAQAEVTALASEICGLVAWWP